MISGVPRSERERARLSGAEIRIGKGTTSVVPKDSRLRAALAAEVCFNNRKESVPNIANTRQVLAAAFIALLMSLSAFGQGMTKGMMSPPANVRPPGLKNVGIEQHLDEQIPPGLTFRDETGKAVRLGDYFGKKPMILNLVYYQCPMLCGEVLSGLESALRVMKFDVGREFDVLTVSFDPRETPEMATKKKAEFLKRYGRAGAAEGWHFLTGPQESIDALTKAAGFQYQYDPKTGQFAHATAIMVLTPERKDRSVLLRRRVRAERFAPWVDTGFGEQDRHAGRPGAAVLLSLRSGHRQIRSDHFARPATFRAGDRPGVGNAHDRVDPFGIGTQSAGGKMKSQKETKGSADDRRLKTDD